MKLISFCSFKGGAGKTTALMGICSALVASERRVALFEADENLPLEKWKTNAISLDTWDSNCEVLRANELALLEQSYEVAETQGYEFALADTHGGSSELNNTIIASSDFMLLPTMLTPLDVDETLSTYRYAIELLLAEELDTPIAILKQRVPTGNLTISQKHSSELLDSLPCFEAHLPDRDAFAAMKRRGMLHKTMQKNAGNPAMRLQVINYERAIREVNALKDAIIQALAN